VATAASLAAAHDPDPVTIGAAAGAAVIVVGGPIVNRYVGALMLSKTRQRLGDATPPAGAQNP
jgi:hypothetical protein